MSVALPEPRAEGLLGPFYDFVNVPSPAAGANAVYVVKDCSALAVVAARALFVADGNAANRVVCVDYIARGVTFVRNGAGQVYVASSTTSLEWQANRSVSDFAANAPTYIPLLAIPLPQGFTVQLTADSIQAGDQFSAIALTLLRWAPDDMSWQQYRAR